MLSGLILAALLQATAAQAPKGEVPQGASGSSEFLSALSESERAWLREHPVIRVVQDPGWPPVEYVDERGEPSGMAADYLKLVEKKLGRKFEQVKGLSWQEAYARLKNRDIDMTTSVAKTPERTGFLAFTRPYIRIPIVIATRSDVSYIAGVGELKDKKIAVVEGYAVNDWIPRDFPGIELVLVKSAREGLEAVRHGKAFAYIDNLLIIGYLRAKYQIANIKIAGHTPYENAQSMAVRKDWLVLAGIIQKALDSVTEAERGAIYAKWVPVRYEHGFNYVLFWQVLAGLGAVLALMVLWNWRLSWEIKRRKLTEIELRESSGLFESFMDNVPSLVIVKDDKFRPQYFNKAFLERFPGRQWLGKTPSETFPADVAADMEKKDSEALKNRLTVYEEHWFDKSGAERTLETRKFIIERVGKPPLLGAIIDDITERKLAEEATKNSEAMLNGVVTAVHVGLGVADNRVIEWANDYLLKLVGREKEEVVGKNSRVFYDTNERYMEAGVKLYNNIREKGSAEIETVWKHKDGRNLNIILTGVLLGGDGVYPRLIYSALDITERKRMEEEILRSHKLDSLGVLAGGIAHDFNNILTGIVGNISMVRHNLQSGDRDSEILGEAEKAGFEAKNLTRQLLTFAKGGNPVKEPTALRQLLTDSAVFATRGTKTKCSFEINPDISLVNVDRGQISQVVGNMVINAVQAMPEGGDVMVSANNVSFAMTNALPLEPGDYVRIGIKDTGEGIPAKYFDKIFDPYFTTKKTGNGLGLATSYSIIKNHGGCITVESEPGKGTAFSVYLPAFSAAAETARYETKKEIRKGGGRVLVMDDEQVICAVAVRILEGLGYRAEAVTDSDKAVERYRQTFGTPEAFDAVILDLTVPGGKGGKAAIAEIKAINPAVKAVVSSGYSDDPIVANHKDYGFSAVLPKPYSIEEVSEVMFDLLMKDKV